MLPEVGVGMTDTVALLTSPLEVEGGRSFSSEERGLASDSESRAMRSGVCVEDSRVDLELSLWSECPESSRESRPLL